MIASLTRAWSIATTLAFFVVLAVPTAGRTDEALPAADATGSAAPVEAAEPAEPEPEPVQSPVALPAAGGRDLFGAAETSKLVVVGRIAAVEKIDLHGYAADFSIDQVLRGRAKAGTELRVAWEELAPSRPVRFADGQRVLLCLDPPPNYTLWQKRFPDNLGDIMAVSREGEAFWRQPDSKTLHQLEHYLALGKDARDDPAALAYVMNIAAVAPELIALQALGSLDAREDVAARLSDTSAVALAGIAANPQRPVAVRRGALLLIGRADIQAARDGIVPVTEPGSVLRPEALSTLGQLDDGLPQDLVARLLKAEDGNLRAVGTLYLRGDDIEETLARLVDSDPSPAVRVAAATRLLQAHGADALGDVAHALGDDDPSVRLVVARDVAKLGESVVPGLEELANTGTERQAEGVVLALTMIGGDAGKALVRLNNDHESLKIRTLAGIALGHMPGHSH